MAVTDFSTSAEQTVKLWSKLLMYQVLKKTWFGRFAGTGPDNIIQIISDLRKGAGDDVKFDVLAQETGYGVSKNTALTDGAGETALSYQQDSVSIEQKRLAKAWNRMSQQRTLHQLRMDAMRNLSDAWARIMDQYMFAHLCGTAGTNSALATDIDTTHGANALVAIDSVHLVDYASTPNTATFATTHIDELRWKAETLDTPLQKIRVDGREVYVMFIHPAQAKALQADTNFRNAMQNAAPRDLKDNPIFSGALGMWNDVVIHASNYLPVSANLTKHAVLCGKQAGVVAYGNSMDSLDQERYGSDFVFQWVERTETDYNNIKGISAGAIFGIKRVDFALASTTPLTRAFGVIRLDTTDADL